MTAIFAEDILSAVTREQCQRLSELAAEKVVIELGAQFGRSTIALASTALRVHSVDWHLGDCHAGMTDSLPKFVDNLSRYKLRSKVIVHIGRNEDVLPLLKDNSFDMAFIDSFHEKDAVEKDIALVMPLLRTPSTLVFHDYEHPMFPGVTVAVNNFASGQNKAVVRCGCMGIVSL